jgi:hypothetical protein
MIWFRVARILPKLLGAPAVRCSSDRFRHTASTCFVAQLWWRNASRKTSFMIPPGQVDGWDNTTIHDATYRIIAYGVYVGKRWLPTT